MWRWAALLGGKGIRRWGWWLQQGVRLLSGEEATARMLVRADIASYFPHCAFPPSPYYSTNTYPFSPPSSPTTSPFPRASSLSSSPPPNYTHKSHFSPHQNALLPMTTLRFHDHGQHCTSTNLRFSVRRLTLWVGCRHWDLVFCYCFDYTNRVVAVFCRSCCPLRGLFWNLIIISFIRNGS